MSNIALYNERCGQKYIEQLYMTTINRTLQVYVQVPTDTSYFPQMFSK